MENWRCVESYTSYKEEITRVVDCDDYTSGILSISHSCLYYAFCDILDYQSDPQTHKVHIVGGPDEEDIWSTTSAASTLPAKSMTSNNLKSVESFFTFFFCSFGC